METTQPTYKISGKKRSELKFVVDCMKRIYNYYHDEDNEHITEPPNSTFTDYLWGEMQKLQEKIDEKLA